MRVVDFHTHIFPASLRDRHRPLGDDPVYTALYSDPKAKMVGAEELIAAMDAAGVDVAVALNVGWRMPRLCAEVNDYIMQAAARYPDRLLGFCTVNPRFPGEALAELERCYAGGLRGLGELRPDDQGFDLSDAEVMRPIVRWCLDRGWPLLTHASEPVGHTYPGKGSVTPDMLYRFASAFPDVTFVCAHWGGGLPFYALMPEVASALANTYFDTAASPFLYREDVFLHVSRLVGVEKVLFGTDYPLLGYKRYLRAVHGSGLAEEQKALILGGNASRLLGLPDA